MTLDEIKAEGDRLAIQIGAGPDTLPTYGYSEQTGRPHIEVNGNGYHYVVAERGHEFERWTTPDLDELLYNVFQSVTFGLATDYEFQNRVPGQDFRRLLFQRQIDLLSLLSPRWAARCSEEMSKILESHPFDDKAIG